VIDTAKREKCLPAQTGEDGQDGKDGQDGQSFDGSFTSPNGEHSIEVADTGIVLTDMNGATVVIANGEVAISGDSIDVNPGGGTAITSGIASGSPIVLVC
jgi:hypothetical protein